MPHDVIGGLEDATVLAAAPPLPDTVTKRREWFTVTLSTLKDWIVAGLSGGSVPVATTAIQGKTKVDHDSVGDPVALTSLGHGLALDPHPQYALDSEKGAVSGIATLDGAGKLTSSQLPLGSSGIYSLRGK